MMEQPRGFRALVGVQRARGLHPSTTVDSPWHPMTAPNAVTFLRLLGVPAFLIVALRADGVSVAAASIYFAVAATDYLDGFLARWLGQYSRLGTLIDPLVDRLLVIAGIATSAALHLLPVLPVVALVVREIGALGWSRYLMRRGIQLPIHWFGRIGVCFAMAAPVAAFAGFTGLGTGCLVCGIVLGYAALAIYIRDGRRALRGG